MKYLELHLCTHATKNNNSFTMCAGKGATSAWLSFLYDTINYKTYTRFTDIKWEEKKVYFVID